MSLFDQQGNVIDLTGALDVFAAWIDEALNNDAASPPPVTIEHLTCPKPPTTLPPCSLSIGRGFRNSSTRCRNGSRSCCSARRAPARPISPARQPSISPTATGGFELKDGPLRELPAAATAEPGRRHVLIIDEMNRGNRPKIFGELYFLLEYRDASIRLPYSPRTPFQLPRNLFVIGTMKTADRSIAALDATIRRRFAFLELHPDDLPVRDVLARWAAAHDVGGSRAVLLNALNDALGEEDRDFERSVRRIS